MAQLFLVLVRVTFIFSEFDQRARNEIPPLLFKLT